MPDQIPASNTEARKRAIEKANGLMDPAVVDAERGRRLADQRARIVELEADRDALRAKVERVRDLHRPDGRVGGDGAMCVTCTSGFGTPAEDPVPWPCRTRAALDGDA